jgi:hypothetical protein
MAASSPAIATSHSLSARACDDAALGMAMGAPLATNGADHIDRPPGSQSPRLRAAGSSESSPMRMRTRKLIGAVGLLALVTAWALIAMAVAQFAFRSTNDVVAWIYYAVAGLGWVLPAMPLISWMSRPD